MIDRPMRRHDRILSAEETEAVLKSADYGVLSTVNADGSAYGWRNC